MQIVFYGDNSMHELPNHFLGKIWKKYFKMPSNEIFTQQAKCWVLAEEK